MIANDHLNDISDSYSDLKSMQILKKLNRIKSIHTCALLMSYRYNKWIGKSDLYDKGQEVLLFILTTS